MAKRHTTKLGKSVSEKTPRDKSGGEFGQILREAIRQDGRKLSKLSEDCGIANGKLSLFMREKATLTLKPAASLAEQLGLKLVNGSAIRYDPRECTAQGVTHFKDRAQVRLDDKLAKAAKTIQILTTRMTPGGSLNYLASIVGALNAARVADRELEVAILASHPDNEFLAARARQRAVSDSEYRDELRDSLNYAVRLLRDWPNCKLYVYRDFPIQIWYRVDDMLFVNVPALGRPTSENCVLGLDVDLPGVRETFLDHFDKLLKQDGTEEYAPAR